MSRLLACRIASYGPYQERGWSHLPEIGVHHVEIHAPAPDELEATGKKLENHALQASSLQGRFDVKQDDPAAVLPDQLSACQALGATILFLSVRADDAPRSDVYQRLWDAGDLAADAGVTLALETHPDLVTNMDVAMQTMRAVNHPHVQINFDTANVHFYNENVDEVDELNKAIDHVAAVHLKDTNGEYKTWHFPALGQGVVKFPKVLATLDDAGFTGPYTMELEGIKGVEYSEADRLQYIADSVAYLRSIGMTAGTG